MAVTPWRSAVRGATAVGLASGQRLPEPIAERQQSVERRLVDQQFAGATAGDPGWREVGSVQPALRDVAPETVEVVVLEVI